jgi:hypothetical protein
MTGAEFQAQALAVVEAHTRGQGLPVMDAHTDFIGFAGAAAELYFDAHTRAQSEAAGMLCVLKSSAGRAQCQWEKSTGPPFSGPQRITRWLDESLCPQQVAQLSFQPSAFGPPSADRPTLFVRDVRSVPYICSTADTHALYICRLRVVVIEMTHYIVLLLFPFLVDCIMCLMLIQLFVSLRS